MQIIKDDGVKMITVGSYYFDKFFNSHIDNFFILDHNGCQYLSEVTKRKIISIDVMSACSIVDHCHRWTSKIRIYFKTHICAKCDYGLTIVQKEDLYAVNCPKCGIRSKWFKSDLDAASSICHTSFWRKRKTKCNS